MKRLALSMSVLVVAALMVGVALGRLSVPDTASAEEGCAPLQVYSPVGGEPDVYIQDMDGNGEFDAVAEAVTLLSWYFAGGPPPAKPCEVASVTACQAELAALESELADCRAALVGAGLPDTGQDVCYDAGGTIIECADPTFPGQDGAYITGCPPQDRFVDNNDDTVTDTCTGLMWQKKTAPGIYTWGEALRYCVGLQLGGHSDWRLPNVRELQSIVDYGRWDPTIEPIFDAVSNWYWSSSSNASDPDGAWYVGFINGYVIGFNSKGHSVYVRAVRTAE